MICYPQISSFLDKFRLRIYIVNVLASIQIGVESLKFLMYMDHDDCKLYEDDNMV